MFSPDEVDVLFNVLQRDLQCLNDVIAFYEADGATPPVPFTEMSRRQALLKTSLIKIINVRAQYIKTGDL